MPAWRRFIWRDKLPLQPPLFPGYSSERDTALEPTHWHRVSCLESVHRDDRAMVHKAQKRLPLDFFACPGDFVD